MPPLVLPIFIPLPVPITIPNHTIGSAGFLHPSFSSFQQPPNLVTVHCAPEKPAFTATLFWVAKLVNIRPGSWQISFPGRDVQPKLRQPGHSHPPSSDAERPLLFVGAGDQLFQHLSLPTILCPDILIHLAESGAVNLNHPFGTMDW